MEKTINEFEAQRDFGKILQGVISNDDKVIVEKHGEPVAVVVPVELYRQWQRDRAAFFDTMREAVEKADMSEEEANELIEEVITEVRSRQRVVEKMREMAGRADMSPEEADELAAEAVQWARSHKD